MGFLKTDSLAARLRTKILSSRNWLIAFLMLMIYVALITVSSQLTSIAFTQSTTFRAPFLFILFKMIFRTLAFPFYVVINGILRLWKHKDSNFGDLWMHCRSICGPDGVTWRGIVFRFFPTALTMLLMQIGYTLGLMYLSTSMATALYCAAVAMSYGLTWVFFRRPLLLIKSFFVLVSFAGVGLIAYANFTVLTELSKTITGIVASLLSALFLTLHQISFMKAFPMGDLGQVSFALSGMNILICIIYWPVPLVMRLVDYEVYDMTEMPASFVVASWICTGISSTTAGYGLVLSSPFFMSIGELMILAANSAIDVTFRHLSMPLTQLIGTVLIGVAFFVLVIPDSVLSIDCGHNANQETFDDDLPPVDEPRPFTIEEYDRSRSIISLATRRNASIDIRKLSVLGRRRSSVFSASGEMVDKEGRTTTYEFYPSSEPCMILSNRRGTVPVALPEARVAVKSLDVVRRLSVWNNRTADETAEPTDDQNVGQKASEERSRKISRSMSLFQ